MRSALRSGKSPTPGSEVLALLKRLPVDARLNAVLCPQRHFRLIGRIHWLERALHCRARLLWNASGIAEVLAFDVGKLLLERELRLRDVRRMHGRVIALRVRRDRRETGDRCTVAGRACCSAGLFAGRGRELAGDAGADVLETLERVGESLGTGRGAVVLQPPRLEHRRRVLDITIVRAAAATTARRGALAGSNRRDEIVGHDYLTPEVGCASGT